MIKVLLCPQGINYLHVSWCQTIIFGTPAFDSTKLQYWVLLTHCGSTGRICIVIVNICAGCICSLRNAGLRVSPLQKKGKVMKVHTRIARSKLFEKLWKDLCPTDLTWMYYYAETKTESTCSLHTTWKTRTRKTFPESIPAHSQSQRQWKGREDEDFQRRSHPDAGSTFYNMLQVLKVFIFSVSSGTRKE